MRSARPLSLVKREHLIEQGFDFFGRLMNAQLNAKRLFARQLRASGTAAAKTLRAGARYMTEAGAERRRTRPRTYRPAR